VLSLKTLFFEIVNSLKIVFSFFGTCCVEPSYWNARELIESQQGSALFCVHFSRGSEHSAEWLDNLKSNKIDSVLFGNYPVSYSTNKEMFIFVSSHDRSMYLILWFPFINYNRNWPNIHVKFMVLLGCQFCI
jgi:hypothetical protein